MSDTPTQNSEDVLDELRNAEHPGGASASGPAEAPPKPEKRNAPVFGYLAILFAVAFFMLLLAYFMQQRNTEAAMSGLRDSISQFQTLDELKDENETLYGENQALREELATLKSEYAELQTELEDAENTIHDLRNDTGKGDLLVLEAALREEQYADAATVCLVIQKRDLSSYDGVTYVADSSTRVDPMQRFQEISEQLIALGYLERDPDSGLLTLTQLALDNGAIEVSGTQSTQG